MERKEIIRIAREAGINFDPAGAGDDGVDMWYENQYLPSGALQRVIEIVQTEERNRNLRKPIETVPIQNLIAELHNCMANITAQERIDLLDAIAGNYCHKCGYNNEGKHCHCDNDE